MTSPHSSLKPEQTLIDQLQSLAKGQNDQIQALNSQVQTLLTEKQSLLAEKQKLQLTVQDLQSNVRNLSEELEMNSDINPIIQENQNLKQEKGQLQLELEDLKTNSSLNFKKEKELNSKIATYKALKNKYRKLCEEENDNIQQMAVKEAKRRTECLENKQKKELSAIHEKNEKVLAKSKAILAIPTFYALILTVILTIRDTSLLEDAWYTVSYYASEIWHPEWEWWGTALGFIVGMLFILFLVSAMFVVPILSIEWRFYLDVPVLTGLFGLFLIYGSAACEHPFAALLVILWLYLSFRAYYPLENKN